MESYNMGTDPTGAVLVGNLMGKGIRIVGGVGTRIGAGVLFHVLLDVAIGGVHLTKVINTTIVGGESGDSLPVVAVEGSFDLN